MRHAALALLLAATASTAFAQPRAPHRCAADARSHAARLLALHRGPDDRIAIDSAVRVLAPVRNPVGGTPPQLLDVLEVQGYIYRARYRMRFLYAPLRETPNECVLMGQEILELARV
ncbi:hypothetical protein [Roseisolibacter agri]|uniref:hypothetical protein n=1 Tax=Roseisolibacter agri TaxID=2014610 RepID=UPI0024E08501|nr:hypothetical protein [Roseisolibacter agri]